MRQWHFGRLAFDADSGMYKKRRGRARTTKLPNDERPTEQATESSRGIRRGSSRRRVTCASQMEPNIRRARHTGGAQCGADLCSSPSQPPQLTRPPADTGAAQQVCVGGRMPSHLQSLLDTASLPSANTHLERDVRAWVAASERTERGAQRIAPHLASPPTSPSPPTPRVGGSAPRVLPICPRLPASARMPRG